MKNYFVIIVAIFIFTGTAFAKLNPEGKKMLGVNGDLGFTFTDVSGDSTASSDVGKAYGVGIKVGYGVFSKGIIYGGLELQQREMVVQFHEAFGDTYDMHYTQKFIDIPAAFRLLFGPMYADFGGYYGIRIGDMKYKATEGASGSGTVPKSETKNDYGLLLAIGGIIPIAENGGIDLGIKAKYGFANTIDSTEDDFKVSCLSLNLTLGYIMCF